MATKVTMEALSPTMEEGRLVKWLKAEGDAVKNGDVVAEVETDKAVMELTARGDGILRQHVAKEGDTAPVGALLGIIAGADEDISALAGKSAAGAEKGADAAPQAAGGENQPASSGQQQARGETKSPAAADRRENGARQKQGRDSEPAEHENGDRDKDSRKTDSSADDTTPDGGSSAPRAEGERVRSSPLARRLASESGVDIARLEGSGPGGRIIKRDVLAAEESGGRAAPAAAAAQRGGGADMADYEDIPLTQIRKTIARRLSESIGPIPTFYLTAELDLERVAEMRGAMAALGDEYKVSFNDIIMKAIATALAQHPECNAHWLGDRIRQFNRVHLGMAVATDDGLIVPVIFDADTKSLRQIASESRALAKRARERKLKPEEFTGSTFSVSNLGMFGIDDFTAIINPPESGIIAIGAIEEKPVREDDELVFRKRMRITMSCDHRVIDGAVGARFLQTLRRMLENPLMLVY